MFFSACSVVIFDFEAIALMHSPNSIHCEEIN